MLDVFFWVTYVALWVMVAALSAAVFLLYRYHGQMLLGSRDGRTNQGPELHAQIEGIQAQDLYGNRVALGGSDKGAQFVFFGQTDCKPCQVALPALRDFAERYKGDMDVVFVCGGEVREVARIASDLPRSIRVVPDSRSALFAELHVSSTPFAFITDAEGIVRGRGMPTNTEAFEWFVEQLHGSRTDSMQGGFVPLSSIESRSD